MNDSTNTLAIALFSEILTAEQLVRNRLSKVMPKGMEISHFSVLNHLAHVGLERTPAQLAQSFHVTRGAMTNTLNRLELAGYVHVRPDWDDARRKLVGISNAGRLARATTLEAISPMVEEMIGELGHERVRAVLPILRELRGKLE